MKNLIFIAFMFSFLRASAAVTLMVQTNGTLAGPTNFFTANSNSIIALATNNPAVLGKLDSSGGVATNLTTATAASTALQVVNKTTMDTAVNAASNTLAAATATAQGTATSALPKAGGTMTGTLVFSGGQPTATTSTANIVQLSSSTNSTSATLAATPAAVKLVYDAAIAAIGSGGGGSTNYIANTNGTGYGLSLKQTLVGDPQPLTIYTPWSLSSTNGVQLGNGYNVQGDPGFAIPWLRPSLTGHRLAFDLFPNLTSGITNVWMDICSVDYVTVGSAGANQSFLHVGNPPSGAATYWSVSPNNYGSVAPYPLVLSENRNATFIGNTTGSYLFDIQEGTNSTWLGFDTSGTGFKIEAHNTGASARRPLLLKSSTLTIQNDSNTPLSITSANTKWLSRTLNYWSYDTTDVATLFAQWRPATNVNIGLDSTGANARFTAFNDSLAVSPFILSGSSLNVTVDGAVTYPLVVSNNVVTATTFNVSSRQTIGNVIPSNRSSLASFEGVQNSGANGSANWFSYGGSAGVFIGAAAGTLASPTASTTAQVQRFAGMVLDNTAGNTNWSIGAAVGFTPTGTSTTSDHGMTWDLSGTPSGTTTRVVHVLGTGAGMAVSSTTATTPAASAALDVQSTTKGFLPPRMTTTQRDAISSPAAGLTLFDNTTAFNEYYTGSGWIQMAIKFPSATLSNWIIPTTTAFVVATTTVTVTGASVGQLVMVSKPFLSNGNCIVTGEVTSANTVTLTAAPLVTSALAQTNSMNVTVFAQ